MKKGEKSASDLTLFIDTSCQATKIAIFANGKMLVAKEWNGKDDLSEILLIKIDALLNELKVVLKDLCQIAVNPGPGSYTGLRIGITVANFLAWSHNVPVIAAEIKNNRLIKKNNFKKFILPNYQKCPHITKPKVKC